jgi:hypothetical protein
MNKMELKEFQVKSEYFDHPSWLHGVNHTCRVMSLVWAMGCELGRTHERDLALCAAYIHDMARKGDGICRVHGPDAAATKLPVFQPFFLSQGIIEEDICVIETAITNHSQLEELDIDHPHYNVTALLKDADALDRFRLGPFDLNKKYLRLPLTQEFIPFARKLFLRTATKKCLEFEGTLEVLENITGKRYPRN